MLTQLSWQKLLRIDGLAGLFSGVVVLSLNRFIAQLTNVPTSLLMTLAVVAFVYASYSLILSTRSHHPKGLLTLIVVANGAYALYCLVLLFIYYESITALGVVYFLIDFVVVATLAWIEGWKLFVAGKRITHNA